MDLTLTVTAGATGGRADVRVTAPDAAPAPALLSSLRAVVGAEADCALSVDGRLLITDGTVADCGLVAGAVVVAGRSDPPSPSAACQVAVHRGPDAGRRWPLTDGDHVLGRDPKSRFPVADRAVSRQHLTLCMSAGKITATDLGSHNGTVVDGVSLTPGEPVEVAIGTAITVGDSEIVVEAARRSEAVDHRPRNGGTVHRSPRLTAPTTVSDIRFPSPPVPATPVRIPVLAAMVPLIAGTALALVLHQWQFLAFTVLSPIMILGQAGSDRWSARRTARHAARDHDRATSLARRRLDEALDDERRRRRQAAPDLAGLTTTGRWPRGALWQRDPADPAFLTVRLGLGDLPCETRINGAAGGQAVTSVPVCLELGQSTVVGISGARDLTLGLARSLIVQTATLHSPHDLRIAVLAPGRADDWAWARWLPHLSAHGDEACTCLVGFDAVQAASRIGEFLGERTSPEGRRSRTLVVVDGTDELRGSAAAGTLLSAGARGISVIWCAAGTDELPSACRAVVEMTGRPRLASLLTRAGAPGVVRIAPDLLSDDVAEATARALAPLSPTGTADHWTLPSSVRWSEVSDVDLTDHDRARRSLARLWSLAPTTEIAVGREADSVLRVDLRRDGPHALIAGTTGSGKSELLLGLIAGLAARNRPDALSLLLIDHKGGAAFGPCARLPHTVGVVTDLDGASTQRALLSLSAEIRRREALFASTSASDLAGYDETARHDGPGSERLPRLVIVVDEFAALAEEQPDFVGGLVGIAQRGRSLGVHLILATQRPDGVVSADIRANTRLRICLGVARDSESRDVIDCADAASISRLIPGRGYLRVGPGDLREFQSARIGGVRLGPALVTVALSPVVGLGDPPSPRTSQRSTITGRPTDLTVLIEAAVDLAGTLRCPSPPPPWLPPLPDDLPVSMLPVSMLPVSMLPVSAEPAIAWGLADLPAAGRQHPLLCHPYRAGTTVIAGAARSGRTSAALTLAVSVAARLGPDQLQIWAIDSAAGLTRLATLPHCGAVVEARDVDRVERLLGHLTEETARRRLGGGHDEPALMLLIDTWDGLAGAGPDRDCARIVDTVLGLAADGPSAGLHTVITSGRSGLVGRLGATASEKVVLRLADSADFTLLGMPVREVPRHLPPGRGVRAIDLTLVQIARLDEETTTKAQAWAPPRHPLPRFHPLPRHIPLAELTSGLPSGQLALGRSADDLSRLSISRADIGASVVVAGPPGSGQSTAMVLLARQLSDRPLAICCPRRSPLFGHPAAIELPRDDQDRAVAILDALSADGDPGPDILIDDLDLLSEGPLWARLEELVRSGVDDGVDSGRLIVIAATAQAVAAAFRGPMAQARKAQVGLLLRPANLHDGEIFGVRLASRAPADDPPGRGWFVSRGVATRLQLADPTSTAATVSSSPGSGSAPRWPGPARPSAPGCDPLASTRTTHGLRH